MEGNDALGSIVPYDITSALAGGKGCIVVLKVYKGFPESGVVIGGPVCNRVLLKEGQTAVQAYFLTGVDEGLAAGKGEAKHSAGICGSSFTLELGTGPGVLIMVGCEGKTVSLLGEAAGITGNIFLQILYGLAALCQAVKKVMKLPGVICIEGYRRV